MSKLNLSKVLKDFGMAAKRHSPEILTGIGVAGMITTTVLAVKATPKALQLIEEEKEANYPDEEMPKIEKVKTCWKCYIPTAVTGVVSVACIVGASRVSVRRNAALATAYKLSETALTEYQQKVVETIGEKKAENIRHEVNEDRLEKNPVAKSEIYMTERGNTRCYDHLSGRRFNSDIDQIKKIVNDLNYRMFSEMYISLNEFYDEIGLEHTALGDQLGWNMDKGKIEVDFDAHLDTDGHPCIMVDFLTMPQYNFDKYC